MKEVKLSFYIENPSDDPDIIWEEFKKHLDTCPCPADFLQWRDVDPETYKPIEVPDGIDNF